MGRCATGRSVGTRELALAAFVVGCGPAVAGPHEVPEDTSTTSGNDASSGAEGPTTADTSTTSASSSGTTTDESTGAAGSSTGEAWTWQENSFSALRCEDGGIQLFVEIYLQREADFECVPPPDIDLDELVIVAIGSWDGEGGTFMIVDDGPVRVGWRLSETVTGSVTVEIERPFVPSWMAIDITTESGSLAGSVGLAACFAGGPPEPCDG